MTEKIIRLHFGYERGTETLRDVVISRRVTGSDLFRIADEGDGQSQTQFQLMVLQSAITKFGDLKMPVPMNVLLSLKRPDRKRIADAYDALVAETTDRASKSEKLGEGRYKLARGFDVEGTVYDVVEFGNHLTGYDELEADEMGGYRKVCFLIGKELTRISQSSGPAVLSGPFAVEMFEPLLAEEVFALQRFETDWYNSFRDDGDDGAGEVADAGGGGVSDDAPQPAGGHGTGVE
jgi:hypothetical protein